MTINKNNCEAYLLDYIEGNLDPLLTAELMAFLAENPDYDRLLGDMETSYFLTDSVVFAARDQLKKDISDLPEVTAANFEEFCIAACEGTLSNSDSQRLSNYIGKDPVKAQTLHLYGKLRLIPDLSITYNHKESLRKPAGKTRILGRYYAWIGVAASLALLMTLWIRKPEQESRITPVVEQPALSVVPESIPSEPASVNTGLPIEKANPPAIVVPVSVEETTSAQSTPPMRIPGIMNNLTPLPGRIATPEGYPIHPSVMPDKHKYLAAFTSNEKNTPDPTQTDHILAQLADKINLWKTAETAVQGFNYLTEARVSINRTTDDEGNTTALLLETERYTVSGKKWK